MGEYQRPRDMSHAALVLFLPLVSLLLLGFAISFVWRRPADFIDIFRGKFSRNVILAFVFVMLANILFYAFVAVLSYV